MSDFPVVAPTLNLDFVNSRQLDPRVTFRRASTGTYVDSNGLIKTAGIDTPRFDHDPVTGVCKGLLIEQARTNSFTYSEHFNDVAWTKDAVNVISNSAFAPDGTFTADKIVSDTSTAVHRIRRIKNLTSPSWSSFYLKAAEYSVCDIYDLNLDRGCRVNLITGEVYASPSFIFDSTAVLIEKLSDGWFRVSIGRSAVDLTVNNPISIYPNGGQTYTGNGVSGIYIWGAQLEAGSFPTSHIPTTTSTVTRSEDFPDLIGPNFTSWADSTGGTVLAEYFRDPKVGTSARAVWSFSNDSPCFFSNSTGGYVELDFVIGIGAAISGPGARTKQKAACRFQRGSYALVINNGAIAKYTTPTPWTVNNRFRIGRTAGGDFLGGTSNICSCVSRIAYWPKRLSDAELKTLTRR